MRELRYTLLPDGPSDRALLPILTWLVRQHLPNCAVQADFAEPWRLPSPPRDLPARIDTALDLYPCGLLFIHRDAEREPRSARVKEMDAARQASANSGFPAVCVVPVRMTEAWLLIDEGAIRTAAGNPNGRVPLDMHPLGSLEQIPDPKGVLNDLLLKASELTGRRRRKFRAAERVARVAGCIADFALLRRLDAFRELEAELSGIIRAKGWAHN